MDASVEQKIAITQEIETSIRLIIIGLRELQNLDRQNDFYFLPFQLLSSGLERFLKVTICFQYYSENNSFPNRDIFPKGNKGHDLLVLFDKILEKNFTKHYLENRPVARLDYDFLTQNKHLRKLIEILSDFGQGGRYYNLDIVLNKPVNYRSPEEEWERIELEFLKENPNWAMDLQDPDKVDKILKDIIQKIVILFERFIRAVSRLYTLGDLGREAERNFSAVKHFIFLTDEKLGKIDYSKVEIY